MNLNCQEAPAQTPTASAPKRSGKPVLLYILILFIVAFLLMALSFFMHQRSSSQAMGQLETSFNATIEEMQETKIRISELEKTLAETEAALSEAELRANEAEARLDAAEIDLAAQRMLYAVQQKYSAGDYAGCQRLIEEAESSGLANLLPSTPLETAGGVITAPFVRFHQFKYAVSLKLAEQADTAP